MAKNKANKEAEVAKDEVTYEEEVGGQDQQGEGGEQSFFQKYKNLIYVGVAVLIAGGAYLYVNNNGKSAKELEALGEMAMSEVYYQQDSMQKAINGDAQSLGFEMVTEDYSGTDAANISKYYIGTAKLKMGQIDEGISYLEEFEKGDNMVAASAYAALGYAYEQKMAFGEAAEHYQKAAVTPEENDFTTPLYLLEAARNQESAGDPNAALETYKRVKNDFPNYDQVLNGNVEKYIAKLGGTDA